MPTFVVALDNGAEVHIHEDRHDASKVRVTVRERSGKIIGTSEEKKADFQRGLAMSGAF